MERVKILIGKKVSLVVPEKQDVNLWYKGINDIETQAYLGSMFGNIVTEKFEEEYFDNLNKDDKQLTFSIYLEKNKKIIGNASLMNIDYKNNHTELGIAIFDKENQNKGYGSETIKLIQKYVFEILGLNKLYLRYLSKNERAGKVYEKCGFKEVGRLKEHGYRFGEFYDDIIMEIMKKDYLGINKK